MLSKLEKKKHHAEYMVNWRKLHPHYYTEFYRKMMDELRQQFGGKCKHCGSTEDLEFAHIK